MDLFEVAVLEGRVEQVGDYQQGRQERTAYPAPRQQVDGDGRCGQQAGLEDQEGLGVRGDPVQGYRQQKYERRVVREEIAPHDGGERHMEPAQQPDALIWYGHVEAGRPVAVVDLHGEKAETKDIGQDQQRHGQVGQDALARGDEAPRLESRTRGGPRLDRGQVARRVRHWRGG